MSFALPYFDTELLIKLNKFTSFLSVPVTICAYFLSQKIELELSTNQQQQQQISGTNSSHSLSTVLNTVVNSNSNSSNNNDDSSDQDRKRIKLEQDNSNNDLAALKRRILEHKYMRLKSVKEKYSEHVAELFFLQSNMNMMEYPTWRKKPQTPEFMSFVRAHRLDQSQLDDLTLSSQSQSNSTALGTEVKIPGIGATPVAVSTRLPAAVAQLSQQGGVPLVPELDRKNRSLLASSMPNGNTSIGGGGSGGSSSTNGTDQFSVKAKQEVYVMQRISELQREGLWSEKRLPKIQEPSRPKAHWDYLLEEMVWLAADFAQERKWKKAAAKKCARMVQKHFQDKAIAAQKAEKAQEANLKRIAAFIAKEIKVFWSNVEKLVEFKQQTRLDEKRKKALDQQLSFIVDQTERYSKQLAVGLNQPHAGTSKANSLQSSRISSPTRMQSDDEFRPIESESDDETTIAQAEKADQGVSEEIAALQKESEMDLDDFLKQLPADYLANRDKIELSEKSESSDGEDGDKDFKADESSTDDEDTIQEQEKKERGKDHKQEIEELEADNDLTIDQLMAKYKADTSKPLEVSDDDESTPDELESEDEKEQDSNDEESQAIESDSEAATDSESKTKVGLKTLLDDKVQDNDELLNDAAALAESIQPKGNTLSSTSVVTPIPFLLKHTLREYQHIGLDWLVTMHDRKLNGILADEMGLGKTIQTIALLAHLACVKGNWGPHLIIVPSSVMLNWEMEFMKWCPGFKILVYYGSQKERKLKRIGWTKANAFHVCITSYKLVIQDHQSFRRKKWKYLILDEAQNIKNFKSQRWQLLLNFQTEQRLLLTGTPLQNNLMELWSLMHFLMPHVFQSHREFREWFSNPMTGMIEGNSEYNESIIKRLHKVLRPFLLRRLKSEVEKQMPKKYEHVVMCRLSKRQRYLYEDFMSRAKTKETLASGNLLSVINVLMQLRKVCNHPNLFETRPTISPFRMDQIVIRAPSLVCDIMDYDPFKNINLASLNLLLIELELCITAYVAHRANKTQTPRKLIEEIDAAPEPPPKVPKQELRMRVRIKDNIVAKRIVSHECSSVKVGTSPVMKIEGSKLVPKITKSTPSEQKVFDEPMDVDSPSQSCVSSSTSSNIQSRRKQIFHSIPQQKQQLHELTQPLANALVDQLKHHSYSTPITETSEAETSTNVNNEYYLAKIDELRKERRTHVLQMLAKWNQQKCEARPIFGSDLRATLANIDDFSMHPTTPFITASYINVKKFIGKEWSLSRSLKSIEERANELKPVFNNFVQFVPAVCAPTPDIHITHAKPTKVNELRIREQVIKHELSEKMHLLHPIVSAMSTQFPDPRLIQYDCGKLQTLDKLLRELKTNNHRVLIFTQMTRMLDVLEAFLNYHGHIYLRLDGTTRVEQRQVYMERFNNDKRIFVFILSTRSGGVGVNLTGADTVIFYDSDWNPTMDAQAQDRCHRIGQTRDVHIYRLVSEKTIEENILKKANQKRLLGDLAIEGGNFTTAYFKSSTIQDLFTVDQNEEDPSARLAEVVERDKERRENLQQSLASTSTSNEDTSGSTVAKASVGIFESALATAEDDQDVEAAKMAKDEEAAELNEFDENIPITEDGNVPPKDPEISKAEKEIQVIINQLNPVEKYAMRFVEDTKETWTAIQLEAVEKEIEQQKREWEANRLAEMQREEEERKRQEKEDNNLITYSREDSKNQVNNKFNSTNNYNRRKSNLNASNSVNKRGSGKKVSNQGKKENEIGQAGVKNSRVLRKSSEISTTNSQKKVSPRKSISVVKSPPKSNKISNKKSPIRSTSQNKSIQSNTRQKRLTQNTNKRISGIRKLDNSVADSTENSEDENESDEVESVAARNVDSDDSECSLDVMIDTTDDDPDDSSNQASTNGASHGGSIKDGEGETTENEESDKGMRKTRSRGTVKINLWSLDPNPIEATTRRSAGSKNSPGKAKKSPLKSAQKRRKIEEDTTASETGSDTGGSRSNTPKLKTLQILINKHEQKQANLATSTSPITTNSAKRSLNMKNSNKKLKSSPGFNLTKNHTLDNWIWISPNTGELMPMWCPPTPPQDDNDIYVDYSLGFLYDQDIIPEHQLPPVYIKKDYKRSRIESGFYTDGRRSLKMRKEDQFYAPRSLFDRPAPALAKMRRELHRNRGIYRTIQIPGLKQQIPLKPLVEPEGMSDWSVYEDMSILNVIQNLQGLPLSLMLISPGHTPNWDLVADIVNQTSRTYRSPKQCRYRYEAIIVPREEGKAMDSPKKQKKNKSGLKTSPMKGSRSMRTSQLYSSDNNNAFTKYARMKFDVIKATILKKGPQPKQVLVNPQYKNPRHAQLLAEFGIICNETPLKPQEIAAKRVERITKEKQKTALHQSQESITVQQQQQQQTANPQQIQPPQQIIQVQQGTQMQLQTSSQQTGVQGGTAVQQIVVQQGGQNQPVTALMPTNAIQVSRSQSHPTHASQIVKAIVATGSGGQQIMQQITLADRSQTGQQTLVAPGQQNQSQIMNPNSVSVVLSSPVTTVSTGQQQQPQIVSIQQSGVGSIQSPTIVSQAQIMQAVTSQQSQVVSVAQLATIGVTSVSSPSVATLTTQSLRTQRIVASGLQEVVLHQRQPGTQSPTVVSVSGITPSQLSAMRLSMGGGQQMSNVAVAKSIPVGTVVTSGKPGSSQIQFYRQPIRQQVKVVHANTGQATGQTALVGPGGLVTNIQGNIQVQGGTQKVAIASAGGTQVQTVATVQMAQGQQRTQFVKPVNAGKQITRQIGEGDMQAVMVKRPVIGQHKQQLIPQAQLFTSGVQVQQAGSSTQGQIATLVKTSSGLAAGIPLSQVKAGQLKTAGVNTTQVRQIQLQHPTTLLAQQRKGGKVTQIAQVGKTTTLPTQLIVQNAKNMPGTVTVQQIQPVFRHAQPGQTLQASQIMLGKNMGRMIPVSVGSQPNQRQTIQVVTGSPGTTNLRAHQNFQNVIQGAIKVSNTNPTQQQQAILTALQNPGQRSNQSPVRLQTGGSLVAVTVQQSPNSQQQQQQAQLSASGGIDLNS
uniref:CSON001825 protein n=1 Tax=Culicoides sonorensis TaxID=179676 RepID=A0A336MIX0_CULSO